MKMFRALIVTAAAAMLAITAADAQVVRRAEKDAAAKKTDNEINLSVRAKGLYESNSSAEKDIPWMRVVYRQLDLTKDANLPLYYPEDPTEDLQNLFRILLRLLADNKVTAYEYLDGREVFTDKYKVNVREMLDRFSILYTEQKGSTEKNPLFAIDESDVPCYEVLSYYLIEKWAFNRGTSRFDVMIEAICPVLHRSGDFGSETTKYPMFWLNYDEVSPYLGMTPLMTSSYNNVSNMSIDDYFVRSLYEGDIYKTANLQNKLLAQYCPNDTAMKAEQQRIEKELVTFENKLWGIEEPEEIEEPAENETKKTAVRRTASKTSEAKATSSKSSSAAKSASVRTARQRPAAPSNKSASSSQTLSVRRQRR